MGKSGDGTVNIIPRRICIMRSLFGSLLPLEIKICLLMIWHTPEKGGVVSILNQAKYLGFFLEKDSHQTSNTTLLALDLFYFD